MSSKRNFEDSLDRVINNPSHDLTGVFSYLPILMRVAIPIFILIVALLTWSLTSNKILTALITGLSLGPIMNFDRAVALWIKRRQLIKK